MKVVILCGGLGTRLREETEFRPKPMVQVGGRPILWHIMKIYAHHGFNEFVLTLGYLGDQIRKYFLNYEAFHSDFTISLGQPTRLEFHERHDECGIRVTLAETGLDTMTGGRIRRVAKYLDGESFCVTYGDGVSDIDLGALYRFHKSHGRLATITTVRPTTRYGILDLDDRGRVNHFAEKPQANGWASAGFFVFERPVLDALTSDDCVLEREPLEQLAEAGQLMAYRHEGFFFAVDTYREYVALNDMWQRGEAPWRVW